MGGVRYVKSAYIYAPLFCLYSGIIAHSKARHMRCIISIPFVQHLQKKKWLSGRLSGM